jgi:hypothetical protein
MADLEASMRKQNINIDPTTSSSGHALFVVGFSFDTTSNSSSDEWIIDSRAYYHMSKDKDIFSALNECNSPRKYLLVMIDLLVM